MGSPGFVYFAVWGGVLLLYMLDATTNLVPVNGIGLSLVTLNIASMFLICFFFGVAQRNSFAGADRAQYYEISAITYFKVLVTVWFFGTSFEVFYQQGFPLYWVLVGDGRLYTDFGIPSFHGVMNAMYLQSVTVLAYLYLLRPKKIKLCILLILLLWPVMMLGRGILLSAVVQIFAVFLLMRRVGFKSVFLMFFVALTMVFLFGLLGDMRQTVNPFSYLVRAEYVGVFSSLPSGFLWFYIYLTSGMSNLFFNVESLQPVYAFEHTFYNLIPSALKISFGLETRKDLFVLVDNGLNASTFYAAYISDFGVLGAFFTVFFIQICCGLAYFSAKKGSPWGVFSYSVALQILVFSIFYDLFFILPVLMQFVLAMIYFCSCRVRFYRCRT